MPIHVLCWRHIVFDNPRIRSHSQDAKRGGVDGYPAENGNSSDDAKGVIRKAKKTAVALSGVEG